MNSRIVRTAMMVQAIALMSLLGIRSQAQLSPPDRVNGALVNLEQKLDNSVPADAGFFDETGKAVKMGDYYGRKPVLLCLIFYKCPGVCMKELEGLVKLFNDKEMSLRPGKDFEAVVVSINPKENPEQAASKKREFQSLLRDPGVAAGWHFLTGAQEDIKRVADAVGFHYTADLVTERFVHPAGIIMLTPQGKTSKYLYGSSWQGRDARLALVDASGSKIGSISDRILVTCVFQYDPKTGRYGMTIMRVLQISGILTVLILATSIVLMSRRPKDALPSADQNTDAQSTSDRPTGATGE